MTTRGVLKAGPIGASFSGKVTLSDIDQLNGQTVPARLLQARAGCH
jgi:hypothetical protein